MQLLKHLIQTRTQVQFMEPVGTIGLQAIPFPI